MTREPYELEIAAAETALQSALKLVSDEIAAYPTPISGCDQQYIRLIADRTRLSNAVRHIAEIPFVATPRMLEAPAVPGVHA